MTVYFLVQPFMYESQSLLQTITWFLQRPGEADLINPVLHMIMKPAQGVSVSSLWSGGESVGKSGEQTCGTFDVHLEHAALKKGEQLIDEQDKRRSI